MINKDRPPTAQSLSGDSYLHAAFPSIEGPYGGLGQVGSTHEDRESFNAIMQQTWENWGNPDFVVMEMIGSLRLDSEVLCEGLADAMQAAEVAMNALARALKP